MPVPNIRRLLWIAMVFALVARPAAAQDADRIDQVVKHFAGDNRFMGTVLVAKDGAVVFSRAYGFANLEWQIPNTVDTRFRIGSISKQFTAAAVLLLEERGKLQTTDLVKKHLPDAPAAWDGITIHHLLTHTSGIPNLTALPEYESIRTLSTRPDRLVASFSNKPLDFAPGERFNYSNSGYVLLAALVERVAGQPFERFVQENIFDRLVMKHTGSDTFTAIIPRRAAGYSPASGRRGGELRNAQYIDMTIPIGGGSLYSTTDDLARWAHTLFGGKLLSAESLRKMTRPEKDNYAYGLGIGNVGERRAYTHTGGIEGFNSALWYFPESKTAVVVLGNVNGDAPATIANRVARLAHGDRVILPTERKEITLSRSVLAQYVGVYEVRPGQSFTIALVGDNLRVTNPQGVTFAMFAESETKFFGRDLDVQFEFSVDAGGKATQLVTSAGVKALPKPE